jgi:hypothetical protein
LGAWREGEISPEEKLRLSEQVRQRQRLTDAAAKLERLERRERLRARDELHTLEAIERQMMERLDALWRGAKCSDPDESEDIWGVLGLLQDEIREACITYCLLAFGTSEQRARFALNPDDRPALIREIFEAGGVVVDDDGHRMEIAL